MRKFTKIGVGVLTAAVVATPMTAAEAATHHAAKTHAKRQWTVVETLGNAKQEACKVSINNKHAWRIVNRLDDKSVTSGRDHASLTVLRNGKATSRRWASGKVRPGHVSGVGSLVLPRKAGYTLRMVLDSSGSGTSGTLAVADIGHC